MIEQQERGWVHSWRTIERIRARLKNRREGGCIVGEQ